MVVVVVGVVGVGVVVVIAVVEVVVVAVAAAAVVAVVLSPQDIGHLSIDSYSNNISSLNSTHNPPFVPLRETPSDLTAQATGPPRAVAGKPPKPESLASED